MANEIIVDDALISTDIDNIIAYISSKKRVKISDLAHEFNMEIGDIKKWIDILESGNYVKVEYHFLNEFVVWNQKEEIKEAKKQEEKGFIQESLAPEEQIERILEKIKDSSDSPEHQANENTLSLSDNQPSSDLSEKGTETETKTKTEKLETIKFKQELEPIEDPTLVSSEPENKDLEEILSLKKSLSEYMNSIKTQKQEIEALTNEKSKLYSDLFHPLEKKFEASYHSISEKLLEKERQIMQLKEQMAGVPTKIKEVEKANAILKKIKQESDHSLASNRKELYALKESIQTENKKIDKEIEELEKEIKAQKTELVDLSNSFSRLADREQELGKELAFINKQLAEINENMTSLYASFSKLSNTRDELSKKMNSVKTIIDEKTNKISESYLKFNEIKKAEAALEEYFRDYEKKIEDVVQYVQESDKEFNTLKQSAEMIYIHNYLKELESLASNYEYELEAAGAQERSIEERLNESKENLNALLKESRLIIKSLESKTSAKDFDKLLIELKTKQETMLATIQEKSTEREKLKQDNPLLKKEPVKKIKKRKKEK